MMDAFEIRERNARLAVVRRSLDVVIAELQFLAALDEPISDEISEDDYVHINEMLSKSRAIRENT